MQTFEDSQFELISEKQIYRRYLTLFDRRIRFPAQGNQEPQEHDYDIIGHPQCGFHFVVTFPFHEGLGSGEMKQLHEHVQGPDKLMWLPAHGGYHTAKRWESKVTLLREHAHGPNKMMWVLPTGDFDPVNHGESREDQSSGSFKLQRCCHLWQVTLLREHAQGPNKMMWVLPTGGFDPVKHGDSKADCAMAELSEEAHLKGGQLLQLTSEGHPGIVEGKWCANRFTPFLCINPQEDTTPGARDEQECIEVHRVSLVRLREIMHSGDMLLPSMTTCFLALSRLQQDGLTR